MEFLGVSLDTDLEALDRMVAEKAIPWPQVADGKAADGELPKKFNSPGTPYFYLLDREGRIAAKFSSAEELKPHLETVLTTDGAAASARDTWQRPQRVMDLLGVRSGGAVADVGSGQGYFTFHLAGRVGPQGRVYAVDINKDALEKLTESARSRGLAQVAVVHSAEDDPRLAPASVDAALVADAYHEFRSYREMLAGIWSALRPGGRLGILDSSDATGKPRSEYHENHSIPAELVIADAIEHGFRLAYFEKDFAGPAQGAKSYFLILEKPASQ